MAIQDNFNKAYHIYKITKDIDLEGATLNIPANCILDFQGGSFRNGSIKLVNTQIKAYVPNSIFNGVTLTGTISNDEIYPNWFGAKGDNRTDDTDAFRTTLDISDKLNVQVTVPNGFIYKISDTLNNGDINLNIVGSNDLNSEDIPSNNISYINLQDNTKLFKDAKITGRISNLCIIGKRLKHVRLFSNCICSGLNLYFNRILDIESVFCDTELTGLCNIYNNKFLSTEYFAKIENKNVGLVDSFIYNNYINGGTESVDNVCFQFTSYNGSLIHDNFIDFYRTIYEPTKVGDGTISAGNINSTNNHYQVFKYFYFTNDKIINLAFSSVGDAFNWMKSTAQIDKYPNRTYTGEDGQIYELPPFIAEYRSISKTVFISPRLEANIVDDIIYVSSGPKQYSNFVFIFDNVVSLERKNYGFHVKKGHNDMIYNGGAHNTFVVKLDNCFTKEVESLPRLLNGWSAAFTGQKVRYKKEIYEAKDAIVDGVLKSIWVRENNVPLYGNDNNIPNNPITGTSYFYTTTNMPLWWNGTNWVHADGRDYNKPNIGTSTTRPTLTSDNAGFKYYDTTLNKPIFWNGSKWLDADGIDVSILKMGPSNQRPVLGANDRGFAFYDIFLNRPIFWTGNQWIDGDGQQSYVRQGNTAMRPTLNARNIGFMYYDSDIKKYIVWNGSHWQDCMGGAVD